MPIRPDQTNFRWYPEPMSFEFPLIATTQRGTRDTPEVTSSQEEKKNKKYGPPKVGKGGKIKRW